MKNPIARIAAVLMGLSVTASTLADEVSVPPYQAQYSLARNSLNIGIATFTLGRKSDGSYSYESVTHPAGLASLFAGDTLVTETSRFEYTGSTLHPLEYTYLQTSGKKDKPKTDKSETIQFDWAKNLAHTEEGERKQNTKLSPGLYDVFLIRLALPLDAAADKLAAGYSVLDHREVVSYSLKRLTDAKLKLDSVTYDTEVLELKDADKGRVMTLWLSPALHYLPVQIQQAQPDKPTFTMVLQSITFNPSATADKTEK